MESKPAGNLYRTAWIFYLLVALAGLVWVGWREGELGLALFFDSSSWWLDGLIGLATGALMIVGWNLLGKVLPGAKALEEELGGLLGEVDEADAIGLAVLSGFAEELFFRGAVQGSWGLIPASLLFGILHTGQGKVFRLWTLFALFAGFVLGGLMLWRGNLLAPILAHFLINAVNLRRLARQERERQSAASEHP